jgi:hypothetical protein
MLRPLVSASARLRLRMAAHRMRIWVSRARVWRWTFVRIPPREGSLYTIYFAGTKEQLSRVSALLALNESQHRVASEAIRLKCASRAFAPEAAFVSEAPMLGAIRMPWWFDTPVSLKRPMKAILATYGKELRGWLVKHQPQYRVRRVVDEAEIAEIQRSMLLAYAVARHGESAAGVTYELVRRIALGDCGGRLDLVEKDGNAVACHLGSELKWKGRRYWMAIRFGYPEKVFNDPEQRSDVNSMNTFLALEWAHQNGYDYYDMGGAFPQLENGLLWWKRKRGAGLCLKQNEGFFFLRLPRKGAAQFLWDSPLFAAERTGIALHLGVPVAASDAEVHNRYRSVGYDLAKVYLHCARPPSDILIEWVRRQYAHLDTPPAIKVVMCQ